MAIHRAISITRDTESGSYDIYGVVSYDKRYKYQIHGRAMDFPVVHDIRCSLRHTAYETCKLTIIQDHSYPNRDIHHCRGAGFCNRSDNATNGMGTSLLEHDR